MDSAVLRVDDRNKARCAPPNSQIVDGGVFVGAFTHVPTCSNLCCNRNIYLTSTRFLGLESSKNQYLMVFRERRPRRFVEYKWKMPLA